MKRKPWWETRSSTGKQVKLKELTWEEFISDQVRIAMLSSSEVTTIQPETTKMNSTDIKDYVGLYGTYQYQYLSTDFSPKREAPTVSMSPLFSGAFGCCGAEAMTGCSGAYLTSREMREEFVYMLFRARRTVYFLPTTDQMKKYRNNKDSVLNLLFECGAKEVHKNPNRLHGPNDLHLCVLDRGDPEIIKMVHEKFLTKVKIKDCYGYESDRPCPRFIAERCGLLNVEEKKDEVKEVIPTFQKYIPKRDAFGRFAKKVAV